MSLEGCEEGRGRGERGGYGRAARGRWDRKIGRGDREEGREQRKVGRDEGRREAGALLSHPKI